jgi:hypothetical protein
MEIERVIREVTVRGQVQNMDQVARAYDQVSAASDRNVVAFEKNARAVQSVDRELERMRVRYQDGYREQQKYIAAQEVYRRAVEQGRMTQAAAAAELQNVRDRLEGTTRAHQEMTRAANDNVRSMTITSDGLITVAGHLKTAAAAAYVLSPAFRGLVHASVGPALGAVAGGFRLIDAAIVAAGPRVVSAGAAISGLGPAFAGLGTAVAGAGRAMATSQSAIGLLATSLGQRLLPALTLASRIAWPIAAVMEAVRAWQLGAQELERLVKISADAASLDVTTAFFQRATKAAEDFRLKASDVEETLKRFKQVSDAKLGGSVFDQELDKLVKWGNFANNGGVAAYRQAVTTEEKYRAAVQLITTAIQQGERLAGLELASKFVSPQVLNGLKANGDLLAEMQRKADAIKPVNLVSDEQIARAVNLQQRYDAAIKLLETRWQPIQDALTAGGIRMHEIWVGIVEMVAKAFDGIVKLIERAASALEPITAALGKLPSWALAGGAAAVPGIGSLAGMAVSAATSGPAAQPSPYKSWAADAVATQNAMRNVYELTAKVRQDTSKGPPPAAQQRDALDRARDSVEKYIQVTEAAAKSVGQSTFEQEKYKRIAELTAAANRDGTKVTAELAAEFEKLGNRAGDAARNLRLAQVKDAINFDRQTLEMGLSREDVQIAQQLRGLYPDIATALNSAEAAQMRFNANLREGREIVSGFGNELVAGLLRGENAMQSLTSAAASLISRLASANLSRLLNGGSLFGSQSLGSTAGLVGMAGAGLAGYQSGSWATGALGGALAGASFGPMGAAAGGIIGAIGGLFGRNSQRREQERQQWQQQQQELRALQFRSASIGLDTSTRGGSVAELANRQAAEVAQAVANGSRNILQLQEVHRREMEQLNLDWNKREEEIEKQKREDEAKRAEEQRLAAQRREESYLDAVFNATNDNSTLGGRLAEIDRKWAKARADEAAAGNQAIAALEQAYYAERNRVIEDFNKQAIEEQKRAAEEVANFVAGVSKSITNYRTSLLTGNESTLSASDQFSLTQSEFRRRAALAAGGNRDELTAFSQYSEAYRQAARTMYASGPQYAAVFNEILSIANNLANVSTSTVSDADKIVAAVDKTKAAVDVSKEGIIDRVTTTSAAEQSLLAAINNLTAAEKAATDRIINAINGLGDLTAQIGSRASVDAQQMVYILYAIRYNSTPSSGGGTIWDWLGFQRGGQVPRFAEGGLVTNGARGVDSVLARYGDGYAWLAGGEFVMPTAQAQANLPLLEAMRAGRVPSNDNGSTENFRELGRLLAAQNAKLDRVAALLEQLIGSTEDGSKKLAGALAVKKALPR